MFQADDVWLIEDSVLCKIVRRHKKLSRVLAQGVLFNEVQETATLDLVKRNAHFVIDQWERKPHVIH